MRVDWWPEMADLRPEIADSRSERADFRPMRVNFRPERADFGPERAWGEQMDGRTDGMTNESPPVFYRTSSPLGPLPCFPSLQFTITQSRATGIADHILPLGDLLYPLSGLLLGFHLIHQSSKPSPFFTIFPSSQS